jgi:CRP-like cAMP-binding protein
MSNAETPVNVPSSLVGAKGPELLALISRQPFFKGMKPAHLELLAESAMEMQFGAGQWIFRTGEPANRFYLILEGKVALGTEAKEQPEMVQIRTLGPGDDLGWSWLFPPYYLHLSACAQEPTRAIFFYGTRLREQCETDHEFGFELMKRIAQVVVLNLQAIQEHLSQCVNTQVHTR